MHWYLGIVANPAAIFESPSKSSSATTTKRKSARTSTIAESSHRESLPHSDAKGSNAAQGPIMQPMFPDNRGDTASITLKAQEDREADSRESSPKSTCTSSTQDDANAAQAVSAKNRSSQQDQLAEDSEGERQRQPEPNGGASLQQDLQAPTEQFFTAFQGDRPVSTPKEKLHQHRAVESPLTPQPTSPLPNQDSPVPSSPVEDATPTPYALWPLLRSWFRLLRLIFRSCRNKGYTIAFDSLGGNHPHMHINLRNYFKQEAIHKKDFDEKSVGLEHLASAKAKVCYYPIML